VRRCGAALTSVARARIVGGGHCRGRRSGPGRTDSVLPGSCPPDRRGSVVSSEAFEKYFLGADLPGRAARRGPVVIGGIGTGPFRGPGRFHVETAVSGG